MASERQGQCEKRGLEGEGRDKDREGRGGGGRDE